jgi:hypothetical protein
MNLLRQIEASFPKLRAGSSHFLPNDVTEAELDTLASDIGRLYIEDIPPFLGALLYASAKNLPRDPWKWENLIYYLNANLDEPCFAGSEIGRDAADIAAERQQRLERQAEFERLAPNQIEAVRDWLAVAQSWPLTHSLSQEVADALRYWVALAARSQHPQ